MVVICESVSSVFTHIYPLKPVSVCWVFTCKSCKYTTVCVL